MAIHELPAVTVGATLAALDGYDQAALCAADAPDLPAMLLGKLFRPLGSHRVAVSPAEPGPGLLGLATRLPAPGWLPDASTRRSASRLAPTVAFGLDRRRDGLDVLAGRAPRCRSSPGGAGCGDRPTSARWTRGWKAGRPPAACCSAADRPPARGQWVETKMQNGWPAGSA